MTQRLLPILIGLTLISLSACKGERDAIAADTCLHERVPVENFSLCLPPGWGQRLEQFGEVGSFVLYVRAADEETSAMQIHVKKEVLKEPVRSNLDFAERAVALSREQAPGYTAVRTDPMKTSNDKDTVLHVFEAQPGLEADSVRYYQYVTTYGDIAYGFTAVLLPEIPDGQMETLLEIFKTVRFT